MNILKMTGVLAVAGLAASAAAATFNLGEAITADVTPDGGVTFRAGGSALSFAPFVRKAAANGTLPSISFRAKGDALIAEVKGDPAAFGRVENGRCSEKPSALYFGYGYCVRDPGTLNVPLNGHHNATRYAGFEFTNGFSLVIATTTAPDAVFNDPKGGAGAINCAPPALRGKFGFRCSQPTTFMFVPGRKGAFDCALRLRQHVTMPPSPGFAAKAGKFCVDTWNGTFAQHEKLIRRCADEFGLRDDLLFYIHCWQRHGFDRHLPDVYPPSPTFGTVDGLKRACATAHARGWSFGVHLNVIDVYTNSPWFAWSKICHNAKGLPIKAWINPPYAEQSYKLLPKFGAASITRQTASMLCDDFCPDTVFIDVTGSTAGASATCRDSAGAIHPLIENTAANQQMFDRARTMLDGLSGRPPFVSSEAPCDLMAGHLDGGDCQWMFLSHEKDVYRWMTIGGTGTITKVPWFPLVWHDRMSLHGAGYSARFEGARGEDCHGIDSDDYISCEIMNGHSLMADCYNRDAYNAEAGILVPIDETRCLRQIVRKYWLAQHIIREIAATTVRNVSFDHDDPHRVKVEWSTGMTVFVNRGVSDWPVETDNAELGTVILPQYGFLAFNPSTKRFAAIHRRNGRVVEESSFTENERTVRYVNPRGERGSAVRRLPVAPRAITVRNRNAITERNGNMFRVQVKWDLLKGQTLPTGQFRVSLWLLDPGFREYSPSNAALRVAVTDTTLDRPTEFEFTWPEAAGNKPRVLHVAVCPMGANADDAAQRLKLLGTSAFYRRYRLGNLAPDGTYTPFVCPDANLWDRLFPPKAPVDFGGIQTDKAFRLVTTPGKPDIRMELP